MKTLNYYLLLVGLGLGITTRAQTGFSGSLKTEYVPFSNYVRPADSVKTGSTSDFKRMQLAFNLPLSFNVDTTGRPKMWALTAEGSYAKMTNRNYEETLFPTKMLNAQIGLVHMRPLGKTWSILAMASAGVFTDMEQINKDDILAQGGVLFIKHFNPRIAFGFGPVVTNTFGVPMVLPGLYFNWVTPGRYQLRVNFPEGITFGMQMTPSVSLNTVVELSGMTAERNLNNRSFLLGYQQIIAGLRPEFKLGKSLSFQLTGGTTLARSFSTTSRKLKDFFKFKEEADPRFTTTFYGSVGLKWDFSKK